MGGVRVKVRFYARLRELIGFEELVLELGDPGFGFLMDELRKVLGRKAEYIFADGLTPRHGLLFSVNDKLIHPARLKSIELKDGDIIDIMPPPSGG
ncbi:hypothetical protein DRO58_01515 [Candidatus Bathyarchaeota archaeon]|nr:MAG: hypothetical protein DRO58_01515 [Candidatus Bathyarchaeota archaeon]